MTEILDVADDTAGQAPRDEKLSYNDLMGLSLLTRVLGLWFQNPHWSLEETDEGTPYVHIQDTKGDLSSIIARDETGEYAVENLGPWFLPDLTGLSLGVVCLGMAQYFATQWGTIGKIAERLIREGGPVMLG